MARERSGNTLQAVETSSPRSVAPSPVERMLAWTAPERPEWVRRINEEGDCIDIRGVVPLDEDSLLRAAKQATGLSDFGPDEWYEPFKVLVKSLEQEGRLNLLGRIRSRAEILLALQARLQVEDTFKRHPEIEDEEIRAPFVILAQGRCGSSFMMNLLSQHPDNGVLTHWECYYPCPPPEKASYRSDPRAVRGHRLIDQCNRVTPTLKALHEFSGEIPADCSYMHVLSFASSLFRSFGHTPSYATYLATLDMVPVLQYYKRVLKLLQWKNPRQRWVLKNTDYLWHWPAAHQVFPDACYIWPHRDPIKAMASMVDVLGTLLFGRSDQPFADGDFEEYLNPHARAEVFNRAIDWLESGAVPKERLFNVGYEQFVKDPMATVEAIYNFFGEELSGDGRQAMMGYLRDNPRTARPPHAYSFGTPQMIARDRAFLRRYQEYSKVPSEV